MSNHFFIMSYRNTEAWEIISDFLEREPDLEDLQEIGNQICVMQDSSCPKFEDVENAFMWFNGNWKELKPYLECVFMLLMMSQSKIITFPDNPNDKIKFNKENFPKDS